MLVEIGSCNQGISAAGLLNGEGKAFVRFADVLIYTITESIQICMLTGF